MPTIFGKNQLEHASGAIPLFANGKENLLNVDAIRTSAASCMVAPTPTAAPLQAITIGFKHLYILKVRMPPESLLKSSVYFFELSNSVLKVFSPAERSAPAQNALPAPAITTALIESFLSM